MKTKPVTLTIRKDIIEQGHNQAYEKGLNFSNYVQQLIIKDSK